MAKTTSKPNKNEQPKVQPLNQLKGGSYMKDPDTGKRTLVQETKRKASNAEK